MLVCNGLLEYTLGYYPGQSAGAPQIFQSLRLQLHQPFFMDEIIVTMCWSIWSMRNDVILRNEQASVQRCKTIFKSEFALVILKAKSRYSPHAQLWLEAYV